MIVIISNKEVNDYQKFAKNRNNFFFEWRHKCILFIIPEKD